MPLARTPPAQRLNLLTSEVNVNRPGFHAVFSLAASPVGEPVG
jgi:hypothetical protein